MKNSKKIISIAVLSLVLLSVQSCKDTEKKPKQENVSQVDLAKTYACPMKCEGNKTYNKTGKCPTCGMDLKETENTTTTDVKKQGKEYTSAYVCPMHCKGSGSDTKGICPVCNMDYVKNKE